MRAPRLCPRGHLVPGGQRNCRRCGQVYDQARPDHFAFYTSKAWRDLRADVLRDEPWCACGCGRRSQDVDHIIPRSVRPDLQLERANLRAYAHACHARRTRLQ